MEKKYYCYLCNSELGGECGPDSIYYYCDNENCSRYRLYTSTHTNKMLRNKKRVVFLNTSIITTEGVFEYKKSDPKTVKKLVSNFDNDLIISAIGHQVTADILTELLGFKISMNRIQYEQERTDLCIVFKLNGRPEEGKILTREEVEKIGYKFFILEKQ